MTGMTYTAAFDVGTTQVKAVLVDEQGTARVCASSGLLPIDTTDGRVEQNPEDWLQAFIEVSRDLLAKAGKILEHFKSDQVTGIIMSGQMQDLIALDAQGQPVGPAILYADGRAEEESAELTEMYGADSFRARMGNPCDGSLPIAKLMWMSRYQPDRYAQVRHVLIDAKDYLIWWLTGAYCGDMTACSTAGAILPGWKSGGSFHTLLLGVTELFKVNAHWLSTTVSAGASSATTPSNLMMILGFVPASQFART